VAGGWRFAAGVMQALRRDEHGRTHRPSTQHGERTRRSRAPTPLCFSNRYPLTSILYPLSSRFLNETGLEADLDTIHPAINLMVPIDQPDVLSLGPALQRPRRSTQLEVLNEDDAIPVD